MKCKKCGMEIGQKSRCPICDSKKVAKPKPQPAAVPASPETASADFSKEEMDKIDEFVKAHPKDWNDKFDDFYDKIVFAAGYKETVMKCRHRAEIFDAVRDMLKDAKTLSADLMIRIMEEIPKKYPEIGDYQARALAKEFFGNRKTIKKLTLKEAFRFSCEMECEEGKAGSLHHKEIEEALKKAESDSNLQSQNQAVSLSWKFKENDSVKRGEVLCQFNTNSNLPFFPFGVLIPTVWVLTILLKNSGDKPKLKSPWSGRIVSIQTQVHHFDDVICEIETAD